MGYFIGLPSELDAVKKGVDWMLDEEEDYDTVNADALGPDFDPDDYAERDDVEVVRDETRDGHRYVAFEPQSEDARRVLEPSENSKPGENMNGGENMTEENGTPVPVAYDGSHADHGFGELEVGVRHAGGVEYMEDADQYGDFDEAPVEELGVAQYIEEAVTEGADVETEDLAGFVAEKDDFDYGAMIEAKEDLGGKDYSAFLAGVDRVVSEVNDMTDDLEATSAIYQAMNAEKQADIDSANQAFKDVGRRLEDVRRESEYLEDVADLNGAAAAERQAQQDFEDAEQIFKDL